MQHILLLVTYQTKPNTREAFVEEVTDLGILHKIQKEDGFVAYQYYYDATDANTLLLVEEWESEAKQQAHLQTAHMEELQAVKEKYVSQTSVRKISL